MVETRLGSTAVRWHFPEGLIGYPQWRNFDWVVVRERPLIGLLRSCEVPGLELVVVDPREWVPDYSLDVSRADLDLLEAQSAADLVPLVVVNLSDDPPQVTLNLLGPLALNLRARRGRQIVQAGRAYSACYPLAADGVPVTFEEGLVGFPSWRHFVLQRRGPEDPVAVLASLDEPGLSLLVIDPWVVDPAYAPQPDPVDLEALGVTGPQDLTWLCILDVPQEQSLEGATVNLLGPLALYLPGGRGRQVILTRSRYSVAHSLQLPAEAAKET